MDSGLVGSSDFLRERYHERPADAPGTPTQIHISPSILVYEVNLKCGVLEVAARGHQVLPDCRHLPPLLSLSRKVNVRIHHTNSMDDSNTDIQYVIDW